MTDSATHDFPREIGNPATNALLHEGYFQLAQLTSLTEADLVAIHGVGPKAVRILRETLATQGLSFAGDEFAAILAKPAQRALAGAGYRTVEELSHVTEAEIQTLHGMGANAMKQLRAALAAKGLSFAPEDKEK